MRDTPTIHFSPLSSLTCGQILASIYMSYKTINKKTPLDCFMVPSESSLFRASTGWMRVFPFWAKLIKQTKCSVGGVRTSLFSVLICLEVYSTIYRSEGRGKVSREIRHKFSTNKQRHIVSCARQGHLTWETKKSIWHRPLPPSFPPSLGYRSPLYPLLSSLRRCHLRLLAVCHLFLLGSRSRRSSQRWQPFWSQEFTS